MTLQGVLVSGKVLGVFVVFRLVEGLPIEPEGLVLLLEASGALSRAGVLSALGFGHAPA